MRWLACVALVTGCDLVFALEEPGSPGGPPIAAESCAEVAEIALPAVFDTQSTVGAEDDFDCQGCFGVGTPGADLVYQVSVKPMLRVVATVTPVDSQADFDPVLAISDSCTGRQLSTCASGIDGYGNGEPERIVFNNTTGETRNAFLVVDSADVSGEFELDLQVEPLLIGDTCFDPLMPSTTQGTTIGAGNDYQGCGGVGGAGPDIVIRVDIGTDQVHTFEVVPSGFQASVYLITLPEDNCRRAPACFASETGEFVGAPVTLTVDNSGNEAFSAFLVIDGRDGNDEGSFTVTEI